MGRRLCLPIILKMKEEIIKEINKNIKEENIVQIRVLNNYKNYNYKGFFVKIIKNEVMFYDILKKKIKFPINNIKEVTIITKKGARFSPAYYLLNKNRCVGKYDFPLSPYSANTSHTLENIKEDRE